ncbi:RNA-directed DNA polymerase, partial [Bacteroides ovatus]
FILTKGLAEHQRRIGSSDPVYLKRLIGELCYWRSIEPDNAYVSDSINRLKCLEKGY